MLSWACLFLAFMAGANGTPLRARDTSNTGHISGGPEHVVILSSTAPHVSEVLSRLSLDPSHPDVKYIFNNTAFRGFAANMNDHCIKALSTMDDVSHEPTVRVASLLLPRQNSAFIPSGPSGPNVRTGSTWGLQRISSPAAVSGNTKSMKYTYSWASAAGAEPGRGVDIYTVDTGVLTSHVAFNGRARSGWSYTANDSDGDGHGTHVSGTAAAGSFGVASGANLIAVKVLGSDGSGASSDTIAGMDYVINTHDSRKNEPDFKGSVMSMSWGLTGVSSAIDQAIQAASSAGIHVTVAAGNDGEDACAFSPASSGGSNSNSVVSVGSIGIDGAISSFSNTGSCVDLYAPGEDVLSAWKGPGTNTVNFLSGTSMAAPHVAGLMAYLLAMDDSGSLKTDGKALKDKILSMALTTNVAGEKIANNGQTVFVKRKRWVGEGPWDTEDEMMGRSDEARRRVDMAWYRSHE